LSILKEAENGDFENYSAEIKLLPWKILASFRGELEITYEDNGTI
jgi:hypothetical protein